MERRGRLSVRWATRRFLAGPIVAALVVTSAPSAVAAPAPTSYEVPTPDANPTAITLGPDGSMWFVERAAGQIASVDSVGTFSEHPLPSATAGPNAITSGPDGNLWFTELVGNAVGRMNPAGDLVEYPLPAIGSSPAGIAAGPDGGLWVTERLGQRIAQIALDGSIAETQLSGTPNPTAITDGRDGGMWFTEPRTGAIGRIDVGTHVVIEYGLPDPTSLPTGITLGADGALWFTLRGTNEIGRITTDGAVSTFPIPTGGANPTAITSAPDGHLWFTEPNVDQVARMTLEGIVEEFTSDLGSGVQSIAVTPSGTAWFTEPLVNRLASLEVTPPDTTNPTITITSPASGAWTVSGSGALAAQYTCADEISGSGLASCDGTVASGMPVPDNTLGARQLLVHAADVAGNSADAAAPYIVFSSASGDLVAGVAQRAGSVLTLTLGMGLAAKALGPVAAARVQAVDCATGAPVGPGTTADLRERVTHFGGDEIRWTTDRTWGGQCRTLTLTFSPAEWAGPSATFGPVTFANGGGAKLAGSKRTAR